MMTLLMAGSTTGDRIRHCRDAAELTQRQLADRLGVTQSFVSQIESNPKKEPSLSMLRKIAIALGVSLKDLLPDD